MPGSIRRVGGSGSSVSRRSLFPMRWMPRWVSDPMRYYFMTPPDPQMTPTTLDFNQARQATAQTAAVNDATGTSSRATSPAEGNSSSTGHERSGVLGRCHHRLVSAADGAISPAPAMGSALPGSRDESLRRRPGHRPIRLIVRDRPVGPKTARLPRASSPMAPRFLGSPARCVRTPSTPATMVETRPANRVSFVRIVPDPVVHPSGGPDGRGLAPSQGRHAIGPIDGNSSRGNE